MSSTINDANRRALPAWLALFLLALYGPFAAASNCSATVVADDQSNNLPEAQDVADVPAEDLRADGNEKMRYVLIGRDPEARAPSRGYGLLLILPGGTGNIDFHGFVKRIHKHAVPKGFLSVQLVAPVWSAEQAKNQVWPIAKNRVKEAGFTTEEFIRAVVKDVAKMVKTDRKQVFTLTWSSSGPAGYSMSLQKKTPVTGTLVAMSVFKGNDLPSLSAAKGQAYYILHSQADFIPIRMAEEARDQLKKKKAKVEFKTYAGGHGWHGNVFGTIRTGIEWLKNNHAKH